ncbi:site-specific DNA-methyltransferase [Fulvimarina sp. MAC3]|uniref:site-specific DNA-methyltransferase n=1 Tax=Fulvimarina sp. MAC3 TaxID=3148887 RepID=UPI0031FCED94
MTRRPRRSASSPKDVEALTHEGASRLNNPTAEMASLYEQQAEALGEMDVTMTTPRDRPLSHGETRERETLHDPQIVWKNAKLKLSQKQIQALLNGETVDLGDAQFTWKGKDAQDWSDLVINAPPLYIQEKVHPKAIIDGLKKAAKKARQDAVNGKPDATPDLFADFNGLEDPEARAEFYQHSKHWQNRMILGDSLQVMASLAEREAYRGKVQCIYFDPPYGIKFNSNWQVSTLSRDVKDGKFEDVTREPEQVKAFRDTWKDGIHSYLSYLRDRLSVARELLTESGSIFVQIGDENVHRVRALMDEVFGEENFVSLIVVAKTAGATSQYLPPIADYVLWYAKSSESLKYRQPYVQKTAEIGGGEYKYLLLNDGRKRPATASEIAGTIPEGAKLFRPSATTSPKAPGNDPLNFEGKQYTPNRSQYWKTSIRGLERLGKAGRLISRKTTVSYLRTLVDFPVMGINNIWTDVRWGFDASEKRYVVETNPQISQRCILMTTDPGDLVLDPTCGSGTTATVAEQWGRRWMTIDTSRVALALARTRLMSARYPYYLLADSEEGREKEMEVSGKVQPDGRTLGDIRQGFVYERAPHITLKSIANNAEIDTIWERWQETLEPLRETLNASLGVAWEEWEIPRDLDAWLKTENGKSKAGLVSDKARRAHSDWWEARIARQTEIDASIAKAADVEMLYDRPYEDKSKVRVAGPFTVESLSPHRVVTMRDDTLMDDIHAVEGALQPSPASVPEADFTAMVLEHLKSEGVVQQAKSDRVTFTALEPWPGHYLAALGTYEDANGAEKRAGVLIGPEFGTLARSTITAAAREASDARFDALIACAFNFEAQASDLTRLGPLAILKARMNPDLHMSQELKNTGKGNAFVVFGEPDVELLDAPGGKMRVKVKGVDVFDPSNGEIRSDGTDGIAVWFVDDDYDEESFYVRHAYFLGSAKSGNDPYKSLKTALKAEIDKDAWDTLYSDVSVPFDKPRNRRIAVKVINHFGDEVLKVFGV